MATHQRIPTREGKPWRERRQEISPKWATPFYGLNWLLDRVADMLSSWAFLDILERLSVLSVLVAVIFYFANSGSRLKQKHYQAWQVINTAQGQGGSGGRVDALEDLNRDHVSLVGVSADGAFLQGIDLRNARMSRCDLHAGDLRNSNFRRADLTMCNLRYANFRQANLTGANLDNADMEDMDLTGAKLNGANLSNVDLSRADLRSTDARKMKWKEIDSLKLANVFGMKNAPKEFLSFAAAHGAVSLQSTDEWNALLAKSAAEDSTSTNNP